MEYFTQITEMLVKLSSGEVAYDSSGAWGSIHWWAGQGQTEDCDAIGRVCLTLTAGVVASST